jgi:hypothetical protein
MILRYSFAHIDLKASQHHGAGSDCSDSSMIQEGRASTSAAMNAKMLWHIETSSARTSYITVLEQDCWHWNQLPLSEAATIKPY